MNDIYLTKYLNNGFDFETCENDSISPDARAAVQKISEAKDINEITEIISDELVRVFMEQMKPFITAKK